MKKRNGKKNGRAQDSIIRRMDKLVQLFVFTLFVLAVGIAIIAHLLHNIRANGL